MYRLILALAVIGMVFLDRAVAQENHALGHSEYLNWSSKKTGNCCNNDDCGRLSGASVRDTKTGVEVLIAGQWCPVLAEHYTIKGKSPDWSVRHACVGKSPYYLNQSPCERLLCFMEGGGT